MASTTIAERAARGSAATSLFKWAKCNATHAWRHILSCKEVDCVTKDQFSQSSRQGKRSRKLGSLNPDRDCGRLGSETTAAVWGAAAKRLNTAPFVAFLIGSSDGSCQSKKKSKSSQSRQQQTKMMQQGELMTQERADMIIKAEVKACVAWCEPFNPFYDPFVVSAFIVRNPGIQRFFPSTANEVFHKYAVPIDLHCWEQLREMLEQINGNLSLGADGMS